MKKIRTIFSLWALLALMAAVSSQAASISVTPSGDITFNTQAGTQTTQTVTVNNLTAVPVYVTLTTSGSALFGITGSPTFTIPANSYNTVTLTFTPLVSGDVTGKLTIASSMGDSISSNLVGHASVPSSVQLVPSGTVVFNTNPGATATQSLTLNNLTASPLYVTLSLSGANSSMFQIAGSNTFTIGANGSSNVTLSFSAPTVGTDSAMLLVKSVLGDSILTNLVAHVTSALLQLIPSGTIVFNTQAGVSTSQNIQIKNLTANPVNVTLSTTGSSDFSINGSKTLTVAGNGSQNVTLNYLPTATGTDTGTFKVTTGNGNVTTASLVGHANVTGNNKTVDVANEVDFHAEQGESQCLPVKIGNDAATGLTISGITVTGTGFSAASNTGFTIGANSNGSITVCFAPTTASGDVHGMLTFTYTGLDSGLTHGTVNVSLDGEIKKSEHTDIDSLFFMVTKEVDFNNVTVGTTSCQAVTISNPTSSDVTIQSATITGNGSANFSVSGATNLTVPANSTQQISVCFSPTANVNDQNATLDLSYMVNGTGLTGNLMVKLEGEGLDTTSTEFSKCLQINHEHGVIGPIVVGGTTSEAIFVTNKTEEPVTISGATLTSGDTGSFTINASQFPVTLSSGQTGELLVNFNPTSTSPASFNANVMLNVSGNAMTCGPVNITLHGVGVPGAHNGGLGIDLGTGLTANGTTVIPIVNTTTQTCIIDTVTFTNTTGAAITVNNLLIPQNPRIQIISTSMTFPATISAGGTLTAEVQFCKAAGDPPGMTTTQILAVPTTQSIQPQTFTVQAVQVQAAAVADNGHNADVGVTLSPNPTPDQVAINVTLTNEGPIDLLLYDATGNLVTTIFSGKRDAGTFTVRYDTKQLSSGAYFIAAKLQGSLVQTKLDVVK